MDSIKYFMEEDNSYILLLLLIEYISYIDSLA